MTTTSKEAANRPPAFARSGNTHESTRRPGADQLRTFILVPAWRQYALAFATFVAVSVLNLRLHDWIGHQAIALVYLLSVVLIALVVNRGAIFFGAILTAIGWSFLHAPPRFSFQIEGFYDKMMLATYFVVALTVGQLTTQLRAQRIADQEREARASALYHFTRELAGATNLDGIFCAAIRELASLFNADVALLLPHAQPSPASLLSPYTASTWSPSEPERRVAALAQRRTTGRGTDISPEATGTFASLWAGEEFVGALAIRWKPQTLPTSERLGLFADFAGQLSLALERQRLREVELNIKLLAESERLGRALLNSISHELRTPIAAITGAASGLRTDGTLSPANQNLAAEIMSASERLNRLVQSLLSAARLQSGQLRPKLEWCDVSDLVQVSLSGVEGVIAGHPVTTRLPDGLPLAKVDFVLMEQVLANLLLNVAAHTPPSTPIEITARAEPDWLILEVADQGPGLPAEELERLFDLFHRAPNARPGGTGLGLAIVKGFVEAQGGRVRAENRPAGGAVFIVRLPAKPKPELAKEDL